MKKLVMFVVFALLLTGCGAPEEVVEAQISNAVYNTVQAFTPIPSNTPFNTYTPYPTNTPYRTFTPYPTYTIPPTQTARVVTPTSTPTPNPGKADADRQCSSWWRLAQSYAACGRPEKSKTYLKMIIKKHPKTDWATKAAKRLDELP